MPVLKRLLKAITWYCIAFNICLLACFSVGCGISGNSKKEDSNALLIEGIRKRNAAIVKQALVDGATPNVRIQPKSPSSYTDEEAAEEPWREPTALMLAAMYGDEGIIKMLLSHGADPLEKDQKGKTAAYWAGDDKKAKELLQR